MSPISVKYNAKQESVHSMCANTCIVIFYCLSMLRNRSLVPRAQITFSKTSPILNLRNLNEIWRNWFLETTFAPLNKQLDRYIPRIEKKTAPTNPMNGSRSGTAAANAPRIKTNAARMTICVILWRSLRTLCWIFLQKMSDGT